MKPAIPWPIDDMRAMYEGGMSLQEVADRLGADEWQPYWIEKIGREYRPGQKIVNKAMKRAGVPLRGRGAPMERNGFWRGGRIVDKHGYILVKSPGHPDATAAGYVREHRIVMERTLGRRLLPTEVVHHKNDDKQDNRPENLELFASQADHVAETMPGKVPASRAAAAHAAKRDLERRWREWWPIDLMRRWHIDDGLSLREIARLLGVTSGTVGLKLRAAGHATVRRHGTTVEPTSRHRREAAAVMSTRPPKLGRGARESQRTTRQCPE